MKAQIIVRLKRSVFDPQGEAILGSLKTMGFSEVAKVRQGKIFDVELSSTDPQAVEAELKKISEKLLANTVIEDFEVKVL